MGGARVARRLVLPGGWLVLVWLLVSAVGAAADKESSESITGLLLSRAAPATTLTAEGAMTIVVRADRDLTSVRIDIEPALGTSAGRWQVRLLPLPATE